MIILAEGGPASFEKRYKDNPYVGHLLTPRSLNVKQVLESGLPWGVDCESVRGFEPDRYLALLDRLVGSQGCKFCIMPPPAPCLQPFNLAFSPLALVVGPRDHVNFSNWLWAFALGGDAKWRTSLPVAIMVRQAREYGRWVHARDVCSFRQARSMAKLGCNSCSLPHYGRFNYAKFEPLVEGAQQAAAEPSFFGGTLK